MMTFEEWKKSKKDSGTSASSGKSTSGSSNKKILSFEEWKAQKENGFVGNADAQDIPVYALADKNISSPESLNTLYEKPEPVNMPGLQQLYDAAQLTYDEYVKSDKYQEYLRNKRAAQGAGLLRDSGVSTSPYAAALQQPTVEAEDAKEAELRSIRNYYKMLLDAEQDQAVMDADLAKLENWPEEDRKALETYVNFRNNSISSGGYAVPAQEAYKSLVAKYGKVAVANLSESLQRSQNQKNADMLREESAAKVQEKPGAAILHSAATVPANLLGSVASPMGVLGDLASRTGRYQTLDPYNNGNMANVYSSAVRGQVAEDIAGDQYDENGELIKDGGALRQTAAYAYQGLMSAADSLARTAVGGGSKSITLGLAATGSFGQTVSDASARGATPTQAMLLGVATGGLEVLTEHMQLDEILKVAQGGKVTGKQLVKNIFKQAAIEITEEEASFLGSLIAEAVILREKSGYNQQIAEAVANGASYEEAVKMADKSVVMEAVETAIISGFSGGMSATASSAVANANYKTATREIKKEAEGRLKKLGETEDVPEIAKLVAKRVLGEELTAEEKSKLAHSQYGAQVAKEFDPTKSKKYKPVSERMKDQKQAAAETESEAKPETTDSTDKVEITGEKVEAKKVDAKLGADGKMVWTVEGKETTTDNMQFENADTAYIFEAVEQIENITPTAAPVLIRNVDTSKDVVKQLNGMDEAYTYGYHGYTEAEMQAGDFVSDLTKLQMMEAYRLGQAARNAKVKAQDSRFVRMRTEKDSTTTKRAAETFEANEAQVYFEDGGKTVRFDEHRHKYDDKRMAGVNAAKFLSKMGIGGKFYFYESYKKNGKLYYKNADGNEVLAPNGLFKDADGSIHIDINAGNSGSGTTLFTLGHELTHFVRAYSEAQFQKLADLVKEAYSKTDMNMHERVLAKQEMLSKVRDEDVSYDEAHEEVVADAMSTMFADGNIYDQIVELKTTDKNLFDTIKRFFDDLIAKFKKAYEKLTPDQKDAQDIREMKDMFDRIQDAFANALVESSDNFHMAMESVVESNFDRFKGSKFEDSARKHQFEKAYRENVEAKKATADTSTQTEADQDAARDAKGVQPEEAHREAEEVKAKPTPQKVQRQAPNNSVMTEFGEFDAAEVEAMSKAEELRISEYQERIARENLEREKKRKASETKKAVPKDWLLDFDAIEAELAASDKFAESVERSRERNERLERLRKEAGSNNIYFYDQEQVKHQFVESSDNFHVAMESVVEAKTEPVNADEVITDGAVVTDGEGERFSIRSMKEDIAEGKMFEDLKNVCGWTNAQVNELRTQLKELVEYMIPYRNILDMNETYGREGRRFSPYKPNSDPLYKISMDFSTLCSKRLLTQYVIENLQLRENRPMSAEEQMAIRAMLNEYRKVEKGLQVACAMCYVEAARLKSPKQIQRWLDDPTPHLINYFALKNSEFNASVKEAQADFKESRGYDRNAPKKDMKQADVKELNKIGPKMRSQYKLSAEERAIVERATKLPNSTYLTAGNLANLSEAEPTIYAAYTSFVRTATRSKSLETDEPYYYGDSMRDNGNGIVVTDSFIEAVNRENGMRFSSWSDWRIQHLLDYITAVIDNSVRGAAMHGYTKFGEEVRVLGKTGMMFNMSGVAGTQTGLNEDGTLNFSDTESIDVNEAIQLRNEFPETAGLQCIGVGDAHVIALLRSDIIDYVIPYHVSGLNAALRRMADIHGWKDYTSTQHAAIDKNIKFENAVDQEHWHEEPVYSEFFVGYGTGMTGIEAMKASAEKYKQLCKDRGLKPKFEQFASEENYWKLLIDRKMINQKTGKLIQQKAVTPTFDFSVIKEVVDRHVQNYDAGLEKRALNHIVENWDSIPQRIKDLKKGNAKAKKAKKSIDTLANQTVAAQPKDKHSDRYSNKNEFRDEIDQWNKDGRPKDETFILGTTGDVIQGLGAIESDIYMLGDKISTILAEHPEITLEEIKKIPHILENPILILESQNVGRSGANTRMVVFGSVKAKNGLPVTAILDLRPVENNLVIEDMQKVTSAYTKDSNPVHFVQNSNVLYADKKRTAKLLSAIGFQMPISLQHSGFVGSIAYKGPKIKMQGVPFANIVGGNSKNSDRFSERTDDSVSNRSLLANAFEGLSQNSIEYSMIQEYKQAIKQLNDLDDQLSELNQEIRRLRFGKDVERDSEKLAALEEKASRIAKDINRYDKRLLNMEASEPLRKVLERERKKAAQKTRQRVNEIQQNRKNRKEQTEIKKKIRRVIRDLDKLFNRGDKKRNVKDGLRDFVEHAIKATDVLFMENVSKYDVLRNGFSATLTPDEKRIVNEAEILLGKLDKAYADSTEQNPYNDPAFVNAEKALDAKLDELDSVFEREKIAREEKSVAEVLAKIKAEYKKLEKADQFVARSAYSDAVYDHMTQLADVIGDTKVRDMTTEQLNSLYEMYNWVKATVTMANKFFSENMKKSVEETAKQSVQEFKLAEAKRKTSKTAEKVYAALDAVGWSNEKVIYALRRLNNSAITTLMQNIIDGENVTMRDVREAIKFRRETEKKYNVKKWDLNEVYTFEDTIGNQFELTLAQMLSFYAYSRREAARSHITRGGIVIKPATKLKKGTATAYTISEDGIAEIQNALTKEQRDYVVAMQTYLSDVMGAKGNEVSMKLHGIKMFNEESYFPIRSSDKYLSKAAEADLKNQIGITNMASAGFTNSLVKEAATPIEIGDFIDTWANHVNEMSRYHGFVLPMEDFRKVFNFSKYADKSTSTAVRAAMENAFGGNAVKYFDDLYRDLNSSAATDRESEKTYRKLFSRFKKSAVMYSLSVVVQQPTAIVRAGAMIDRKYFGAFGSTGRIATGIGRLFTNNHTKLWEEMMTYAPGVTMIKDIGGFDTATGGSILQALKEDSYEGMKENWEAFTKHPIEYISKKADDNFLSRIPAYADQIAWVEIWNAVKRETLAKNKNMDANSKEHLEASGRRFSDVIRATQVYDSVFAKSPQMRSQSLAMQMLTSFMAEPNTTINMVEDGIREIARGNRKFAMRELYTVAAAITFNNLIKSVIYAMRSDDEDKNFEEKYLAAVIDGLLNDFNPLTYFAGARDVWSVMRGYDIERADMTLISDVVENLSRVKNLSDKDTSEMTEEQLADHEKKQSDAWWALADSISAIVGFPIKNIRRDVKGFVNTVFGERIGSSTKNSIAYVVEEALEDAKPQMFRGTTQSKTDRLYEVYVSGDKEYLNRIKSQYEDEDAFNKALRKALRENDSRIHEAAQALYENNASEYSKKFNAILREGNFSSHDIREAIDSELSKINSDSSGETSASTYNASDFVKSIIVGDKASAKEIRKEYIANKTSAGMTKEDAEKAFEESVNGNVRDSFKSNLLKKDMAKKIMTKYGGKSEEEVEDKLTCWEFQMEYPDVDISDNAILDYYDIAKPLGIKLSSYLTFVNGKKGAKWDQVVATIHKLPLTQKQKDALYLMAGYAESGLENTPWHR